MAPQTRSNNYSSTKSEELSRDGSAIKSKQTRIVGII